ncbi:hydrogenase maturation nickel metallochaperone HypA [Candidatus Margulisiibacteriota bacterium]
MHELSIIENIFKVIEKAASENDIKKISQVNLKIGKLQQVVPDLLQSAFEVVSKDTLANEAKLVFEEVPVKVKCRSCQKEFGVENNIFVCPNCASGELDLLQGKELFLVSLEGDK